jgi:hypothetical protein
MKKNYLIIKDWAKDLFPLNRSLTGHGNRVTIKYLKKNINKNFKLFSVRSGKKIFSWKVPLEWKITSGFLKYENGDIISNFERNNLEIVGYSVPVNKSLSYKELIKNLHYSKILPNCIPYVTSYYKKGWGFCLSYKNFKKLKKNKKYKATIHSKLFNGVMNYTEMFIKGRSKKEILICSYLCHPSMANNELSGILAVSLLSRMLKKNKYSIRLLLIPETVGAIYYINKKMEHLKKNLILGINLSCVGIEDNFNLISTINENTYADNVIKEVGSNLKNFRVKSFLKRGSNERQFGCQKLNLPFVTITRKKFGEYKEYHTSADNLKILNYKTIIKTCQFIKKVIEDVNSHKIYEKTTYCEPFLSGKKIIDNLSEKKNILDNDRKKISNFLAYIDRRYDLRLLCKKINIGYDEGKKIAKVLERKNIIKEFI